MAAARNAPDLIGNWEDQERDSDKTNALSCHCSVMKHDWCFYGQDRKVLSLWVKRISLFCRDGMTGV